MTKSDPNLVSVTRIAEALGDLRGALVFIGGCATGLLLTATQAQAIRVTRDVDVVVEVASIREYREVEAALRRRGFVHDQSDQAPICRWIHEGIQLDLLPSEPGVLPFHNRWYPLAVATAVETALPSGLALRLITAPVFVATKTFP